MINNKLKKKHYTFFLLLILLGVSTCSDAAVQTIGTIADNVKKTFGALTQFITAASYVGGFGFTLTSIMKFKAHKDSPQQTPITQPLGLFTVGISMLYLPTMFSVGGGTLFSSGGSVGGISGTSTFGS